MRVDGNQLNKYELQCMKFLTEQLSKRCFSFVFSTFCRLHTEKPSFISTTADADAKTAVNRQQHQQKRHQRFPYRFSYHHNFFLQSTNKLNKTCQPHIQQAELL